MLAPTKINSSRPRNQILAALPAVELKRLSSVLEPIEMLLKEVLSPPSGNITHAYFPEDGLVSLVQPLADGSCVEVGLIGAEGFVGIPLLLGARSSPAE